MHVGAALDLLGQRGELEVVRGEEREGPDPRRQVLRGGGASARPSKVLVPSPISSISTRLSALALCRMPAVSVISTMKVLRPEARSSVAPMRVKMRSMGPISARAAGTKLPIWASTTIRAVWRM
jgi:hypothetical protein